MGRWWVAPRNDEPQMGGSRGWISVDAGDVARTQASARPFFGDAVRSAALRSRHVKLVLDIRIVIVRCLRPSTVNPRHLVGRSQHYFMLYDVSRIL